VQNGPDVRWSAQAELSRCELCPRRCGVDRLAGGRGYCRAGSRAEVYRFGPHFGEEPPLSGTRGSGTVFFSRCTLRCLYCQNYPWSQMGAGDSGGVEDLESMLRSLAAQGCHNWNLVSPTPWLPMIREAVRRLKTDGVSLPVVYNTSGYERIETLDRYRDLTAVYLPDLRYATGASAQDGSGASDYVEAARAAIARMWQQAGPLRVNGNGVAVSGTICRILILPGLANEAVDSLRWLATAFDGGMAVSVMAQYLPAHRAAGRAPWGRRITRQEYETVREAMESLAFEQGWIQEFDADAPEDLVGYRMPPGGGEREKTGVER
jgi:putative pyruvate formate lyase activating enzyme